jgi:hypothetical protein
MIHPVLNPPVSPKRPWIGYKQLSQRPTPIHKQMPPHLKRRGDENAMSKISISNMNYHAHWCSSLDGMNEWRASRRKVGIKMGTWRLED